VGGHARRPDEVLRGQDVPAVELNRAPPDVGDLGVQAHFNAEAFELAPGAGGEPFRHLGQEPGAGLDENHAGLAGVNATEIAA